MNFEDFEDKLLEKIRIKVGDEYDVDMHEVLKNNDNKIHGITILSKTKIKGMRVSPNVYIDDFYDENMLDGQLDEAADKIIDIYKNNKEGITESDINNLSKDIENKIYYILVNTEANKKMLADMPHREFLDLSIIYKINISKDEAGYATTKIGNSLMQYLGLTEQQLFDMASKNTFKMFIPSVEDMEDMLKTLATETDNKQMLNDISLDDYNQMLICSNTKRFEGANVMLNKYFISTIIKEVGHKCYILPSSIHEVLMVINNPDEISPDNLRELVGDVNATQVAPEEILSYNIYEINTDGEIKIVE